MRVIASQRGGSSRALLLPVDTSAAMARVFALNQQSPLIRPSLAIACRVDR